MNVYADDKLIQTLTDWKAHDIRNFPEKGAGEFVSSPHDSLALSLTCTHCACMFWLEGTGHYQAWACKSSW